MLNHRVPLLFVLHHRVPFDAHMGQRFLRGSGLQFE